MFKPVYKLMLSVLIVCAPVSCLQAADELAKVVTMGAPPVDCMADVEINKIDGEKVVVAAHGFEIEAGEHTLNGRAFLDTTWCKLAKDDRIPGPLPDLQLNFQAGRTYYVGFDYKS